MKKILCFVIMVFLINFNVYAQTSKVKVDSISAILMDASSGRILWEKKSNEPMSIASTTKIMTCIIALENSNLKDEVVVSKRAASQPEVKMHLSTGETQRLEDLLYALMLQSSNDAAVAIAEHVGGSVEDFCKLMTDKAKQIGALDTVFETPNGLDAGNHHSTAYDMALITRYALNNEDFIRIINTREVTTPVSGGDYKSYNIINTDRLIREYEGANGVKSGYTNKAGHCFVGSAVRGDIKLISVVLASGWGTKGKNQKWIDTKAILDYGFNNYKNSQIVDKYKIAKDFQVLNSPVKSSSVIYNDELNMLLSEDEKQNIKIDIEMPNSIEAPIYKGDILGKAKIYINGNNVKELNLCAIESIDKYKFNDRLKEIANYFFWQR